MWVVLLDNRMNANDGDDNDAGKVKLERDLHFECGRI